MLNKRGQGLSMTMVIVIILALLVLIVMGIMFTGSSTTLQQKIRDFFVTSTASDSIAVAEAQCEAACETAKSLSEVNQKNSGYCTNTYNIENIGQGVGCKEIGVACPEVESNC